MNYPLPDPAQFSVDDLKRANESGLQALCALTAGLATGPTTGPTTPPPDREARDRSAALLEKIVGLWHAEVMDETRTLLGGEAGKMPAHSAADLIEASRATLRLLTRGEDVSSLVGGDIRGGIVDLLGDGPRGRSRRRTRDASRRPWRKFMDECRYRDAVFRRVGSEPGVLGRYFDVVRAERPRLFQRMAAMAVGGPFFWWGEA